MPHEVVIYKDTKLSLCFIKDNTEGIWGSGSISPCVLSLALDVCGLRAPSTHTKKGWVESRVSLDASKERKISFFHARNHSQ